MRHTQNWVVENKYVTCLWECSLAKPLHIFTSIPNNHLQVDVTMATPARYTCKYCNKSNIKSYNGLKQHIATVKRCCELSLLDGGQLQPVEPPLQPPLAASDIQPSQSGPRSRQTRSVGRERNAKTPDSGHVGEGHVQNNFPDPAQMGNDSDEDALGHCAMQCEY
jgi:hypothetical protein